MAETIRREDTIVHDEELLRGGFRQPPGRPGMRGAAMGASVSTRHRVVVVGGGFAGLNVTRALDRADVDVTLVDRANAHLFQPLL